MGAPKPGGKARKSIAMSFRFTPEARERLLAAATHQRRSQANLLEWLLEDYCRRAGLEKAPRTKLRRESEGVR
jgi:hypothetical protein